MKKNNKGLKIIKLFILLAVIMVSSNKIIGKTSIKNYKVQKNELAENPIYLSVATTQSSYNSRNVTITLNSSDNLSGVDQMCIQENSNVSNCVWTTYVKKSSFTVSDDYNGNTVTIYAWVKDVAGNVSSRASKTYKTYKRCSVTVNNGSSYCQADWGSCTKSCGGGTKYATKVQPLKDAYLGNTCDSKITANGCSESCNTQDCCSSVRYEDGTSCSASCGGGTKNRLAYSNYNGQRCSAQDQSSGGSSCNTQGCCSRVYYKDGAKCSKSCGGGTTNRFAYSWYNDKRCSAYDKSSGGSSCNTQDCCSSVYYKDGNSCSKSCGGGTKNRLAYSNYNDQRCSAKDKDSGGSACNTQDCDGIPNGTCKIRGTRQRFGGVWTCSGPGRHTISTYYQIYCKSNGVISKKTTSPSWVCGYAPYGTADGWYLYSD